MKATIKNKTGFWITETVTIILGLMISVSSFAYQDEQDKEEEIVYTEFTGKVMDSQDKDELGFADLEVETTNIRTVTNTEGEFLLKMPNEYLDKHITVSHLGYMKKSVLISDLKPTDNSIYLDQLITELTEINVNVPKDAPTLVKLMLERKATNYLNDNSLMTGFYRETIRKRRKNASLAEAVIEVYKQPYSSNRKDLVKLIKSRKSVNYEKLDTLALKLQGGPFNTLYSDLIKYPTFIFDDINFNAYVFTFAPSTQVDDRQVFVVDFKQLPEVITPLYYGKLFIDAETYSLISAVYNLNLDNEELAAEYFVRKKPNRVKVTPTEAAYRVDYKNKNGKWYYGYSNIQLSFKVNWKGKLFNSNYTLNSEMVITDWELGEKRPRPNELIRPNVILAEEASGFSDPEFWGEYNIIEPDKSIEQAIKKISKNIKAQ